MILARIRSAIYSSLRYFKLFFKLSSALVFVVLTGGRSKSRQSFSLVNDTLHYLGSTIRKTETDLSQSTNKFSSSYRERSLNLNNADIEYRKGNWVKFNSYLEQAEEVSFGIRSLISDKKNFLRFIGSEITSSIGHTAVALATRARHNNLNNDLQFNYLVLAGNVANKFYLKLWEKYFPIIDVDPVELRSTERTLWPFFESVQSFNLEKKSLNLNDAHNSTLLEWEKKSLPPLLTFPGAMSKKSYEYLSEFGLRKNDWFVALHVRSNKVDGQGHGRNANILSYKSAIEYVTSAGGKVIRIGEKTDQSLGYIKGLIDLTQVNVRPDWLDIFILSKCKFLIGTTSGPLVVPHTFGVPILATNAPDLAKFAYYPNSLVIPKLVIDQVTQKVLSLNQMLSSKAAYIDTWLSPYKGRELAWRNNTPDEILEATKEMLLNINKQVTKSQEDLKQRLTVQGSTGTTLVSPSFIKKHSEFLEN